MNAITFPPAGRSRLAQWAPAVAPFSAACALLLGAVSALAQPTTIAGDPTLPQSRVVSLFTSAGLYSDVPGANFYETWWSGQWTSYGDYPINLPATTRFVKGYQGLLFTGVGFEGSPTNVAGCAYLHVDVYTPNGDHFAVRMVDTVGHSGDVTYTAAGGVIAPNTWVHLDIPMNQFVAAAPSLNLHNIQQLGWIINGTAGVTPADYYIDNVYFYSSTNLVFTAPLPTPTPTNNAPTPTRPAGSVLSMYNSSQTYADQGGINWHASWSGSAESNFVITNPPGSTVKYMPGLSYVGVEFYDPNQIDTTGFTAMHFDVWTLDANQIAVELVSLNPTIGPQIYVPIGATQSWVGIDIPLSQFSAANPALVLSNLQQLLWIDNGGSGLQNGTFYIDNVYFWTTNSVAASIAQGTQVSWTAASGADTYQPQKSANGSVWSNWGSAIVGNALATKFDSIKAPFYRVLDVSSSVANVLPDPSFEIPDVNSTGAANWSGSANGIDVNGNVANCYVTNSWGALSPHNGTNLLFMQAITPASGPVTPPDTHLLSDQFAVGAGLSYAVSFYAANPVKLNGANPQYRVRFYDASHGLVYEQWNSFASAGSTWTQFAQTHSAPGNAAFMELFFMQALGAGNNFDWVTLLDDVKVVDTTAVPVNTTNVLSAALSPAVGITWKSGVGSTYTVQSSPGVAPAVWSPLGANVVGTGTNTVSDTVTGSKKFYRVLEDN